MICIPIAAMTTDAAIERIEQAGPLADLIELRIDRIPGVDLERLLAARRTPVIVTNRRREEGGGFTGTEEERVEMLNEAVRLGADYVDIETATDSHLWSETYDREIDDIFAIQDDIASRILDKLKTKLGAADLPDPTTTNAQAYEYYLRGRGYALTRSDHGTDQAILLFRKAVAMDAGFVRAWIGLAEASAFKAIFFDDTEAMRQTAIDAGENALRLEPDRSGITADKRPPEDSVRPLRNIVALKRGEQRRLDLGLLGNGGQGNALLFALMAQPGAERLRHGYPPRKAGHDDTRSRREDRDDGSWFTALEG